MKNVYRRMAAYGALLFGSISLSFGEGTNASRVNLVPVGSAPKIESGKAASPQPYSLLVTPISPVADGSVTGLESLPGTGAAELSITKTSETNQVSQGTFPERPVRDDQLTVGLPSSAATHFRWFLTPGTSVTQSREWWDRETINVTRLQPARSWSRNEVGREPQGWFILSWSW